MKSVRRRRAINIDLGYIEKMKEEAVRLGVKGHTAVASMIFVGSARTLPEILVRRGSSSVSMTEAIWISVRTRGEDVGKTTRCVAEDMLIGNEPPLRKEEIAWGVARTMERERLRAAGIPEEKSSAPKVDSSPPEPTQVGRSEAEDSSGHDAAYFSSTIDPVTQEILDDIGKIAKDAYPPLPVPRENHQSKAEDSPRAIEADPPNIVKEVTPEKEEPKKNLSKGEAEGSEKEECRQDEKIEPGKEFYGGFFSL